MGLHVKVADRETNIDLAELRNYTESLEEEYQGDIVNQNLLKQLQEASTAHQQSQRVLLTSLDIEDTHKKESQEHKGINNTITRYQ